MIELLSQLISIPSLSREEKAAADCLQSWMEKRGLDPHRVGNNLWCCDSAPDGRPTVLLNAHIDTVRPNAGYTRDPFRPEIEGDVLYGLGSNDDGGSLVALLATYMELRKRPQPCRFIFSATAEEEVTGTGGLEMLFPETGKIDFGVIGEPTGMRLAVAERGLMVLDCEAKGVSGHAARGEGVNAIYKALKDIEWLRSEPFDRVSPHLGPVKMSVTMISAGTQHNVVPDTCGFVVDVRPNGMYTNQEILDYVRANVESTVTPRSLRHGSSSTPEGHPFVKKAEAMGIETFGSPTTSNQTVCHFPTVKIGPGDSARSHTADEYILLSEINEAIGLYVELLDGFSL